MPPRDSLQGTLPLLVLTVLDRRGPLHGYGISTHIEGLSDVLRVRGRLSLSGAAPDGRSRWVKARWVTSEAGRRAREYEITVAGRRQLQAEEARWRSVTAAVGHVLKHA
jgi:DNA-binding PadR family transcriptional regulator